MIAVGDGVEVKGWVKTEKPVPSPKRLFRETVMAGGVFARAGFVSLCNKLQGAK